MNRYLLGTTNGTASHSDPESFLSGFDSALSSGGKFAVQVAESASFILTQMNAALRKHGIEIRLDVNSDPDAADYIVNAMLGGAVGAVTGIGAGAALWTIARVAAAGTPIGPFLLAGSLIGLVTGAVGGVAVTHWGLRVRFRKATGTLEMVFSPIQ